MSSVYQEDPVTYRKSIVLTVEMLFRITVIFVIMIQATFFLPATEGPTQEFYILGIGIILLIGSGLCMAFQGSFEIGAFISILSNHIINTVFFLIIDASNLIFYYGGFYLVSILLSTLYFGYRSTILTMIGTLATIVWFPLIRPEYYTFSEIFFLVFFVFVLSTLIIFSKYLSQKISDDISTIIAKEQHYSKMESLAQLTGGVAHDFNNILMAILTRTELLQLSIEDKELLEDLKKIQESAINGSEIVRQLLYYSKQKNSKPEVINLRAQIYSIYYLIETVLGPQIEMIIDIDDDYFIEMDKSHITQLMLNFAVNSADAIEKIGTFSIIAKNADTSSVSWKNRPYPKNGVVELIISDTGTGIEAEHIPKIFDPFFSTKSTQKGTGLGLSTVYGIVKEAGGEIQVESGFGSGATFKVFLPLVKNVETKPAPEDLKITGDNIDRILFVEDNKQLNETFTKILSDSGYNVISVFDGKDAVTALKTNDNIDLVISDIKMPNLDGLELYQHIQTYHPNIRVLLMSAFSKELNENRDKYSNIIFLQKPFTKDELLRKISV